MNAKALVCGVEMATMEDALTRIVDDYLERYHPLAKAQRAAECAAKKAQAADKRELQVAADCGVAIANVGCGAASADAGVAESSALDQKPRGPQGGKLARHVPKHIAHALWNWAQGRCESEGCAATHNLQIDHKQAFSRGGGHGIENLQLLCPSCHRQKTLREFGCEWQRNEPRRRIDAIDWMSYRRGAYIPPVVDTQAGAGLE